MAPQAEEECGRYGDLPNLLRGLEESWPCRWGCKPADRHNSQSIDPIKELIEAKRWPGTMPC
jgi:hypothetical protein